MEAERRDYAITRDTMACRFYDRWARRSPCEGGVPVTRVARYGLIATDPWVADARLTIRSRDGVDSLDVAVSSGAASGNYRVFDIPVRSGILYDAKLVGTGATLMLFEGWNLSGPSSKDDRMSPSPAGASHWEETDPE